jgi:collagen triple helix repeat protein
LNNYINNSSNECSDKNFNDFFANNHRCPNDNDCCCGNHFYCCCCCRGPRGPQGSLGPTGPQGSLGPTGPQGSLGPTGPQGSLGPTGPQGSLGPTGPQGSLGPTGPQGSLGPTGPQGSLGPTGPQGSLGPTGPQGSLGPTGPQGSLGPTGPQGSLGPTGPQGSLGPTGPQGSLGPTGPQGSLGPTGPQGSLGPTGPQGSLGPTGPQGSLGPTGPQGSLGPTGPQGSLGPTGPGGGAVCSDYCCERVTAFITALIDYLTLNPTEQPVIVDITTIGGSGNNRITVDIFNTDTIVNGLLLTTSGGIKTSIRICNIREITFQKVVYINAPVLLPPVANSITLTIADVSPPMECAFLDEYKTLLERSLVFSGEPPVVTSVLPFDTIDFYNFDLNGQKVLSIASGMATFTAPGMNSSVFAPYCSINSLEADFLY